VWTAVNNSSSASALGRSYPKSSWDSSFFLFSHIQGRATIEKLLFSVGIIAVGLLLGKGLSWLWKRDIISASVPVDHILKRMIKTVIIAVNPIIIIGAFWYVQLANVKLILLPFLGVFSLILGGFLAIAASKLQKLDRTKTGSMFVSGSFTNMGGFGTLFCFVLPDEACAGQAGQRSVYYGFSFIHSIRGGLECFPMGKAAFLRSLK
jgi:hypothetical protein